MEKYQILSLGREVIDILKEYLLLEKKVFPNTFMSYLRISFSLIDFKKLYVQCDYLLGKLYRKEEEIQKLNVKEKDDLILYKKSLLKYCEALENTITLLRTVYYKLNMKSINWKSFRKYTWKDYNNDLNKYALSIEDYARLGENLNKVKDKILKANKTKKNLSNIETSLFVRQCFENPNIQKYFNNYKDIENVYWTLMFTGVDELVVKKVITTPELLEDYFDKKKKGITDFLIAGQIMTTIKRK